MQVTPAQGPASQRLLALQEELVGQELDVHSQAPEVLLHVSPALQVTLAHGPFVATQRLLEAQTRSIGQELEVHSQLPLLELHVSPWLQVTLRHLLTAWQVPSTQVWFDPHATVVPQSVQPVDLVRQVCAPEPEHRLAFKVHWSLQ